jgi:hypothetical protein
LRESHDGGVAVPRAVIATTPSQATKKRLVIQEPMVEGMVEVTHMPRVTADRLAAAATAAAATTSHSGWACADHCESDQRDESFAWHCSSSLKPNYSDKAYKQPIKAQSLYRVIGPDAAFAFLFNFWRGRFFDLCPNWQTRRVIWRAKPLEECGAGSRKVC